MKVGDLVKYSPEYFTDGYHPMGLVIEVHTELDPGIVVRSPYRVRWSDHSPTVRIWYTEEELVLINESR